MPYRLVKRGNLLDVEGVVLAMKMCSCCRDGIGGCNYSYELTGFTCLMTRDHGAACVRKQQFDPRSDADITKLKRH